MAIGNTDPRETAEEQAKVIALEAVPVAQPPARPLTPPSLAAARERQAARVREATVARWLRRLSA